MTVKFAEHPQRSCRLAQSEDGLIDHHCSLPELHPGLCCPRTLRAAIDRREAWEAANPGWESAVPSDDPFAPLEAQLKGGPGAAGPP